MQAGAAQKSLLTIKNPARIFTFMEVENLSLFFFLFSLFKEDF